MRSMRRVLRAAARLALICQFAAVVAILAPAMSAAVEAAGVEECTCPVHAGSACPMHHGGADKTPCRIGCADAGAAAAIVSVIGPVAPIPSPAPQAAAEARAAVPPPAAVVALDRALVPDAPPPRS